MCPDELYNTIFFKSGADPVLTVCACDHRARPSRTQRTECHGARKTERDKTSTCRPVSYRPRSLSVALARSPSISLSPSPDKSETDVVEIARNPYRVHQTGAHTETILLVTYEAFQFFYSYLAILKIIYRRTILKTPYLSKSVCPYSF